MKLEKTTPIKKPNQNIFSKNQSIFRNFSNIFLFEKNYILLLKKKRKILEFTKLITKSVDTLRPYLSVRKVRRGRRTFYLPYPLLLHESRGIAMKWIRDAAFRKRKKSRSAGNALGQSIYESLHHTGYGWQKKEELHKLAITYRTSSRFRWWS